MMKRYALLAVFMLFSLSAGAQTSLVNSGHDPAAVRQIFQEILDRQAGDATISAAIASDTAAIASETLNRIASDSLKANSDGSNIASHAFTLALDQTMVGAGGMATATVEAYIASESINRIASDSAKANTDGSNIGSTSFTLALDQTKLGSVLFGINNQTATYVAQLSDLNKLIRMATASTTTTLVQSVIIPPVASVSWPIGSQLHFCRSDVGEVRLVGTATVVIHSTASPTSTPWLLQQYSGGTAIHLGTDVWEIFGHLKDGN